MTGVRGAIALYVYADGSQVPPQLMNPDPEWSVKLLTKAALSSLDLPRQPVAVTVVRDGRALEPAAKLAECDLKPFDVIRLRPVEHSSNT